MKQYSSPKAELLKLVTEDIITSSPGIGVGNGAGENGGEIDFGDLLG